MKIDRENCEAWFLDYYEGNLSKEGVEALFSFLILNPEMREVFDSYEEVCFSPDKQIHFDGKTNLKKSEEMPLGINESNYEKYFVSEVEGLLSAEEQRAMENFITAHPSKRHELELLRKTILIPDDSIVFEHKASLMKSVLVTETNFDEMAIASMEGLLNAEEEKDFVASIAGNKEQLKTVGLYKQTKLSADHSIVFEDKESLKHKDRGGFWWIADIRFAAAAVFALLLGIFFWNYSGNDVKKAHGSFAKIDTAKIKNTNTLSPKSNGQLANKDVNTIAPRIVETNSHPNYQKQISTNVSIPSTNGNDKTPFVFIASNNKNVHLENNIQSQVDFTDAYYNYAVFKTNSPVASKSISPQQAAMRWMKKKLDRNSNHDSDENVVYSTYAANNNKNGDVTGFDLTSSAVNRIGEATGANVHLGKEAEGTILTFGKYRVWLNHNR